MNVFLGIDIGTTNIKSLVLGEDGRILEVLHWTTPKNRENGVEFLDLEITRSYVESVIGKVEKLHSLAAIAFSSFGETVIPVRQREALAKPVMWYDRSTYSLWKVTENRLTIWLLTELQGWRIVTLSRSTKYFFRRKSSG